MARTHSSIATDSERELSKVVGEDATATIESDPKFEDAAETGSSENLLARDTDDSEDSEEEIEDEDDADADADAGDEDDAEDEEIEDEDDEAAEDEEEAENEEDEEVDAEAKADRVTDVGLGLHGALVAGAMQAGACHPAFAGRSW